MDYLKNLDKRKRNTIACRKSRQKKKLIQERLLQDLERRKRKIKTFFVSTFFNQNGITEYRKELQLEIQKTNYQCELSIKYKTLTIRSLEKALGLAEGEATPTSSSIIVNKALTK